jgi:hypothetical protein
VAYALKSFLIACLAKKFYCIVRLALLEVEIAVFSQDLCWGILPIENISSFERIR